MPRKIPSGAGPELRRTVESEVAEWSGRLRLAVFVLSEKFRHRHPFAVREFRISCQPLFGVLFRPEEIIDASTAALKNDRSRGRKLRNLTFFKSHANALRAMRASIFNLYRVVLVSAVDQQQEINRSSDFKSVAVVYFHLVREKVNEAARPPWIFRVYSITLFRRQYAKVPQKPEGRAE